MPVKTRSRSTPRVRRSPDEARLLIFDAAEHIFARFLPDEVGLKEIAGEAGVSHGLVTHYFGTYDALVEATLARRLDAARTEVLERLVAVAFDSGQEFALLRVLMEMFRDPVVMRLLTWTILRGRSNGTDFFATHVRGLKLVVDAMEARLKALGAKVSRERLDFSVLAAVSMSLGIASAGDAIRKALGHDDALPDDELWAKMQAMLRSYLFDGA